MTTAAAIPSARAAGVATLVLALSTGLLACASATDRLEEGLELQAAGQYEGAAYRYIDALDKDGTLAEARTRLLAVGDSAIQLHLAEVAGWMERGRPVEATRYVDRIDDLLARARTVGVRLPVPADYTGTRRATFDAAVTSLLDRGDAAFESGRYQEAVGSYRSARDGFEILSEQRDRALAGEANALWAWSEDELAAGRLQSAFQVADRIRALEWAPAEVVQGADAVQAAALEEGRVELMALPVVAGSRGVRGPALELRDLELRTNEALIRGPWAAPPPFVRLTDDRAVQRVVREASVLGTRLQPAALSLLLRLVEADYGAYYQILEVDATEYDVDQRTRNVRTRDGRAVTYVLERGQRRLRAQARILLVDRDGNPLADQVVVGSGTGRFERGLYEGNPAELNLDRREVDHFDPLVLEAQEQAIRQALALDLADQLGAATFDPILVRIP